MHVLVQHNLDAERGVCAADALDKVMQMQLPAPGAGPHCVVNAIHLS